MDVIDRHFWRRVQVRAAWIGLTLVIVTSLALLWWWYLEWRSATVRFSKLEVIERQMTLIDAKLQRLLDGSSILVFDWKATTPFAAGHHERCGLPGKDTPCEWTWHSTDNLPPPRELLESYLKADRAVLLLIATGHDSQPLLDARRKIYETNLGLAHARGNALIETLVGIDDGKRCEDKYPRLRCVLSLNGPTTFESGSHAPDRIPSLTVFVTGAQR